MLPDGVSNPGPLTYESVALPTVLRSQATGWVNSTSKQIEKYPMLGGPLTWFEFMYL